MGENMQECSQNLKPYMLYGDRDKMDTGPKGQMLRDLEYFQSLYPGQMKQLQGYVSRACDTMDYKNSPMYDEFPDRIMIDGMCDTICSQIRKDGAGVTEMDENREVEEVEIYEVDSDKIQQISEIRQNPFSARPPQGPPPWGPPPRPPQPPRPGGNWMNDIIKVLLLNEMHRRRCQTGRC